LLDVAQRVSESEALLSSNKAVIDRRLPPSVATWEVTLIVRKSSPLHALACNWYYCAQFIAKPNAARAQRFSWAATTSNLGL